MPNPTGYITQFFKWEELYCHGSRPGGIHEGVECEIPLEVRYNLNILIRGVLQKPRAWLGVPFIIVSGYRCPAHNEAVGGAEFSQHMHGNAADIKVEGYTPFEIHKFFKSNMENVNKLGPGWMKKYDSFVHIDIRGHDK